MVWAFFWSVKSGQFDDLEGPAHHILMDRDETDATSSNRLPSWAEVAISAGAY